MADEMILRSTRVVTPTGVRAATVHIRAGRIERVSEHADFHPGPGARDVGELVLMPGVVDTHVHINEPGRTEWEGFESATRAAAAGGITTVVDMPLNSLPPVTTAAGLMTKAETMDGRCAVDVGLWGGAIPDNTRGDTSVLADVLGRGALGFKCFLAPSGVDEFPCVGVDDVRRALVRLHGTGAVFMVHAELPGPLDEAARSMALESPPPDSRAYSTWLRSRPPAAEDEAVAMLYRLCKEVGTPVHIVHLSSAGALETLARARDEGVALTAETAPHYLHFTAEQVPDGATWYKCAPPIRDRGNRDRLWKALEDGLISMVVSDHSPCTPDLKRLDTGDFMAAWGGIAGLQFSLSAVWSEAHARGIGIERVVEWMCRAPARHAGIASRKGAIAEGMDADLVVFDPDATFTVSAPFIHHRNKLTPYEGETLRGVVRETYLRGRPAHQAGHAPQRAEGRWITRS
ncbi:MAG: allantoinase AllB [Deltaproteobacteria bacterium]|nr:allantoinase AllB [Myxococcales bacterium]MDP3219995.1 allantoinase AllB [Deltaproteobacteria bacterium]